MKRQMVECRDMRGGTDLSVNALFLEWMLSELEMFEFEVGLKINKLYKL